MFKKVLLLSLFLGFGWVGASKISNETLSLETIEAYINKAQSHSLQEDSKLNLGELLVYLGVHYYSPVAQNLLHSTSSMVQTIETYCQSLDTEDIDSQQQAQNDAQNAWAESMKAYHRAFTAPFGPLYDNSREISNNIYSWPLMNECGIHVELIEVKEKGHLSSNALYTSKGLMAVEFGLFKDLTTTTCNKRNPKFQKVHDWLTLSEKEKIKDMCRFSLTVAKDVYSYTQKLADHWQADTNNYTFQMVNGSQYESFNLALNKITDGIFTMIEVAKDTQLGKPLGLHKDCLNAEGKCPEDVEHKWSQMGLEAIEAQFEALKGILTSGGLGAHLNEVGHEDIYSRLLNQTNIILDHIASVKNLGTLNDQIKNLDPKACEQTTETNNLVPVCGIQRQIRVLVHMFRSEFFPALHLQAPIVYQGDSD